MLMLKVIFTDETTVKMECSLKKSYRRIGETKPLQPAPKHPYQVNKSTVSHTLRHISQSTNRSYDPWG